MTQPGAQSTEITRKERIKQFARLGFPLSEEHAAQVDARLAETEAGMAEVRKLDVAGYEPHAVFALKSFGAALLGS